MSPEFIESDDSAEISRDRISLILAKLALADIILSPGDAKLIAEQVLGIINSREKAPQTSQEALI